MNPRFSIIIPIYNTPNLVLKSCFTSIKKQTLENYELIVIDDGSEKQCADYIDEQTRQFKNVQVIHKHNAGVSAARNDGIKIAQGEYILFVDADNTLPVDTLETYTKALTDTTELIIGLSVMCERKLTETEDLITVPTEENNDLEIQEITDKDELVEHLLTGNIPKYQFNNAYFGDGPHGKLLKTEIVKQIDFPIHLKWEEDTVWLLNYINQCNKIIFVKRNIYNNVPYEFSATRRFRENFIQEYIDVTKEEIELQKQFPNSQKALVLKAFINTFLFVRVYLFHKNNKTSLKQKYDDLKTWCNLSETLFNMNSFIQVCKADSLRNKIYMCVAKLCIEKQYFLLFVFFRLYKFLR